MSHEALGHGGSECSTHRAPPTTTPYWTPTTTNADLYTSAPTGRTIPTTPTTTNADLTTRTTTRAGEPTAEPEDSTAEPWDPSGPGSTEILQQVCPPDTVACESDDYSTTSTTLSPEQKIAAGLDTSTAMPGQDDTPEASVDGEPADSKSNAWIAAVVIILMLLVAGGIYYVVVHKAKEQAASRAGAHPNGVENQVYGMFDAGEKTHGTTNPIADAGETLYFDTAPTAGKTSHTVVNAAFQAGDGGDATYDTVPDAGNTYDAAPSGGDGQYVDGHGAYVDVPTGGKVHEYEYQGTLEGDAEENTYDAAAGGESFDDFSSDTYADLPVDVVGGDDVTYDDVVPNGPSMETTYGGLDVGGFESSDEDV